MSTVIYSAMVSLDGMFDGPGEGAERIDWFRADDEWLDYSLEILDAADVLLFGWRGFVGMQAYWPTATGPVADRMNDTPKVAFSRFPRETTWRNARTSSDPVGEVSRLSEEGTGTLQILGSADLASTLTEHGLVDEYRFAIVPVALGAGVPWFAPGRRRLELETVGTRIFDSGIVEIRCAPGAATT